MFLVVFLSLYLLSATVTFLFYRKNFEFLRTKSGMILWLCASFALWVSRPFSNFFPDAFVKYLSLFGGFWIFFLYYSLLLTVAGTILSLVLKSFGTKGASSSVIMRRLTRAGILFIIACMTAGFFEAYNPTVRHEKILSVKVDKPTRIVFASDLHLGFFLGRSYSEQFVKEVNGQNADIVLLGGDIIDNDYDVVKRQQSLLPLAKIDSKIGVSAVFGNHDYLGQSYNELASDLARMNVNVLIDKDTEYGQIRVVGLTDYSKDRSAEYLAGNLDSRKNVFNILLEHQPRRIKTASDAGYDLYLAGHTHGGAFFPNHVLTALVNDFNYGRKNFGDMTAIVTSGYGYFGIPVRLGAGPEIVVIDIVPLKTDK